jgi:hypothetical protein
MDVIDKYIEDNSDNMRVIDAIIKKAYDAKDKHILNILSSRYNNILQGLSEKKEYKKICKHIKTLRCKEREYDNVGHHVGTHTTLEINDELTIRKSYNGEYSFYIHGELIFEEAECFEIDFDYIDDEFSDDICKEPNKILGLTDNSLDKSLFIFFADLLQDTQTIW